MRDWILKPAFWLFLLFVLASGLSAWIGNEWGRIIGKRKLTVFALRPKHSSSFLTILLSIALSMGFLGVYLLVDPNAREALLMPESRQEHQSQLMQQQATAFNSTLQRLKHRFWPAGDKIAGQPQTLQLATASAAPAAQSAPQEAPLRLAAEPQAQAPQQAPAAPPARRAARRQAADSDLNLTDPGDETSLDDESASSVGPAHRQPMLARKTEPDAARTRPSQPASRPRAQADAADRLAAAPPAQRQAVSEHGSAPETATVSLAAAPRQPAAQVAMLSAPVFQLRVFGGRSQAESLQILDGVLGMTRTYARDLGLTAAREPLQIQTANLLESRLALQKAKVYQLQVKVGRVSKDARVLPVKLVLRPETTSTGFDPQELLEQARLNPDDNQSLHTDLRQAILALAQETRQDLQLDDSVSIFEDGSVATADLPIQIMKLHRRGNTLQGQIVLLADAGSLTEN